MLLPRSWVATLLRSRGDKSTAARVEEGMPDLIDTGRDRALLESCGINPDILEVLAERDPDRARHGIV